jgi:hypothetical protein
MMHGSQFRHMTRVKVAQMLGLVLLGRLIRNGVRGCGWVFCDIPAFNLENALFSGL